MAINLGADDNGGFGNAFQRQFKRSIGVGGEPSMIEPKRVTQDNGPNPMRRGWNGGQEQGGLVGGSDGFNAYNDKSGRNPYDPVNGPKGGWNGWQEQPQNEGNPVGGGGPMPIPDGGPNWRGAGGVVGSYQGGVNPMYYAMDHIYEQNPRPMPIPDGDLNRKGLGTTGGFDPVGPGGGLGGPQPTDIPNGSGAGGPMPMPWPQGASPVPGNPNAFYMQNHPSNPNSKYAQWKASQQQAPAAPPPGNTGIVPPHRQDGMGNGGPRILGGPGSPPRPQGGPQIPQFQGGQAFNFSDMMQGQPQNGWNWGDLGNIRNRRF